MTMEVAVVMQVVTMEMLMCACHGVCGIYLTAQPDGKLTDKMSILSSTVASKFPNWLYSCRLTKK